MTYAGFRWSFSENYGVKIASALFVLYWAHPLPGNLFGAVRMAMQKISISGAEWCLHTFNIPVWADGLLLRTGTRIFEVPEACSGMNTAMIVVVCALGAGALSNLSIIQRLMLMGIGVVQVLIMNSARIALMVAASRGKPPDWSVQYMHDSTSVLLLLMIVLIQGEAWLWNWAGPRLVQRRKLRDDRRKARAAQRLQHKVLLPRSLLLRRRVYVLITGFMALALLCLAFTLLSWKSTAHQADMIAAVARELAEHNPEQAERAASEAARLAPDTLEHTLLVVRIELMRGKHAQALARLQRLQPIPRGDTYIQLLAWSMMGAGRLTDAQALLSHLPARQTLHPGIAMCATELAILRNDAENAASNVVLAAAWPALTDRIRRTYPFLARHGKWAAIARSADLSPFRDATEFRILLIALITENQLGPLPRLLETNRMLWFGKPDFLPHLKGLAMQNSEAFWQQIFSDSLRDCMERLSADELSASIESCFILGRPELAWLAYRRLSRLDPAHPALTLIPARFASGWFAFRGGSIGTVSQSPAIQDLRPFLRIASFQDPWKHLLSVIPIGAVMLTGPHHEQVSDWVKSGLAELAHREANGTLSYEQYLLYESSLQWTGRDADALAVIDRLEKQFPERSVETLLRRAAFYQSRKLWQPLYETLRRINTLRPYLDWPMQLALAETLARLDMGVCALELSDEAVQRRPTERAGRLLLASIWAQFGHDEEALFTLRSATKIPPSDSMAALLWRSGRYAQASQMYNLLGMSREAARRPTALPVLPPAESVLSWQGRNTTIPLFSSQELDEQIRHDTSPFLLQFHTLTRDWINGRDRERLANSATWKQVGRDSLEQVTALHRFAYLAADSGDLPTARRALDEALQLMPSARLLWRMQIAFSGGNPAIIASARAACPADPEIWLAELASQIRSKQAVAAAKSLREACAGNRYSSATLVRAGYALLRAGDTATAAIAAKQVSDQSHDYLPSCLLGLDTAIASKDIDTAVTMALKTAGLAPDPLPFFRIAIRLGMTRPEGQLSLTRTLDTLIMDDPDNPEWPLRLGTLYFNEGQFDLSRRAFTPFMNAAPANTAAEVLIVMAESARRCGDLPQCVAVLREAFKRYPKDIHVINSLAYTLAQSPATVKESRSFLPRLMEASPTASILDTIAVIRIQSGELEAGHRSALEAMAKLKPGDKQWREIHMNAAEIECALGNASEAEKLLKLARKQPLSKGSPDDKRMTSLELKIFELKQGISRTEK